MVLQVPSDFQFGLKIPWIASLGIDYSMGVDGISLFLIILTTLLYGGMIPALPVFPLVGNVGNPILCAVVFALNDVTPGQMASVVMYNVTHTYICVKNGMNNVLSNNGNNAMGMRFE